MARSFSRHAAPVAAVALVTALGLTPPLLAQPAQKNTAQQAKARKSAKAPKASTRARARQARQNHEAVAEKPVAAAPVSMPDPSPAPEQSMPEVYTATDMPTPIDLLTADIVVEPSWRAQRNLYHTTPFQTLGSMQVFSRGTPGSESGLFIRGAAPQDTQVLVDGFRVSPSGGTDFSLLPLAYGSRTEILRGPASGYQGHNAGSGVIQVLSDPADPELRVSGEAGVGGRGYMQLRGRLSGGNDVVTARVEAGRERSDGFNVSTDDAPFAERDEDGWERDNLAGRLDARLSTDTRATVLVLRNTVDADFDGSNVQNIRKRLELNGLKLSHHPDAANELDAQVGQSTISYDFHRRAGGARFTRSRLRQYALGNTHRFSPGLMARIGIERLEEHYESPTRDSPTRSTNALSLSMQGKHAQHIFNAGLRLDDTDLFKKTFSYTLGYGYNLADNLRLTANLSSGYRLPEIPDYHASPASNRLRQQKSTGIDAGIYWQPNQNLFTKAVLHQTRTRDRLTAAGDFSGIDSYVIYNVGQATVRGLALTLGHDSNPGQNQGLRVQANIDLLDPTDDRSGRELPNVAKQTVKTTVDYGFDDHLSVGVDLMWNNRYYTDEANTHKLGGKALLSLRTAWRLDQALSLYGEIYNLTDRQYSTVRNFRQQARTVVVGVSYSPRP